MSAPANFDAPPQADTPVLAFLGAGLMARPMVERLLAAGHAVHVWNRSRDKLAPLVERGAVALATPREAAEAADVVLCCLLDAAAVEHVAFGDDGALSGNMGDASLGGGTRARVFVDHSSIRPDATRRLADRARREAGVEWIDAPVSGGIAGAAAGTLAVMCGGDPTAFGRIEPLVRAYAANVTLLGPAGAGQTAKLINQVLVAANIATIAEAVSLARAAGIDAGRLPAALAGGWADSKPLQVFVPRMVDGWDAPIGALSTMLKDVDTAMDLSRQAGSPLPMAALAQQLLRLMAARGHADDDPAVLARLYRPD